MWFPTASLFSDAMGGGDAERAVGANVVPIAPISPRHMHLIYKCII